MDKFVPCSRESVAIVSDSSLFHLLCMSTCNSFLGR